MTAVSDLLRANSTLLVAVVLVLGIALVLSLLSLVFWRMGASLRPVTFMAILVAPLLATFLVGGCVRARRPATQTIPLPELAVKYGRFLDRPALLPGISGA